MAVNKDLEKIEQDARSVLSMLPKAGQIKFKCSVLSIMFFSWEVLRIPLPFAYNKTYKLRAYALKDRIRLADKYGEKKLVEIFSTPNSVEFIKVHADILFNAMRNTDQKDFGSLDKFLERIDSTAKEVEMLLIALELRGVAENPKLTEAELKEVLEGIKKK